MQCHMEVVAMELASPSSNSSSWVMAVMKSSEKVHQVADMAAVLVSDKVEVEVPVVQRLHKAVHIVAVAADLDLVDLVREVKVVTRISRLAGHQDQAMEVTKTTTLDSEAHMVEQDRVQTGISDQGLVVPIVD
jgi:hypothetical protein